MGSRTLNVSLGGSLFITPHAGIPPAAAASVTSRLY